MYILDTFKLGCISFLIFLFNTLCFYIFEGYVLLVTDCSPSACSPGLETPLSNLECD